MKIIFGLGNPGKQYLGTRHNVGFNVVARLAQDHKSQFKGSFLLKAQVCRFLSGEEEVVLAKPSTYMNNSGIAVKKVMSRFKTAPQACLVVYDDVDLVPGELRFRKNGSSGGHGGMGSVIDVLGSDSVDRLRVGIGRPPQGVATADYVLSEFSRGDRAVIEEASERAAQACEDWLRHGADYVMKHYNNRSNGKG